MAAAQAPAVTTLEIDVANYRRHPVDISDPLKFATDPNPAPSLGNRTFGSLVLMADIVAVNGKPAKGLLVTRGTHVMLSPNAAPGTAVADVERAAWVIGTSRFSRTMANRSGLWSPWA